MNIQIFGAKKCFDTQKTERYMKERKIKYQYVDLYKYGLSKREFESVLNAVGFVNLINDEAKEFRFHNMQYLGSGSAASDVLFNNPKLMRTPIVRNGKQATVDYKPEVWKDWE